MSAPQSKGCILIVDDEADIRDLLTTFVRSEGYEVLEAARGDAALAAIQTSKPDAVLLDIRMPGMSGMEVLQEAKRIDADLVIVMVTAHATVREAVEALHAGAHDYLVKPFTPEDVLRSLHSAITQRGLRRTIRHMADTTLEAARLLECMGPSAVVTRICADVARVACSDFTVLIVGETGSGKELVARAVHSASLRCDGPFVAVDCGAIPETLVESTLFGHEKGAYTGADRSRPGKFEAASGGTLFLDEISNMPLGSQAKLLRVLQERQVYRVGGDRPLPVDTRVLAAVNQDLENATERGTFRKDLYFRLNEFIIHVPPLRKRKEDIVFLAHRFLEQTNQELGKSVSGLSRRAVDRLLAFDWPGNVRQLRSTVRRAVLLADTVVEEEHLGMPEPKATVESLGRTAGSLLPENGERLPLRQRVRRATMNAERAAILEALEEAGWNKAKAARLLEIDYKTLHTKLRELGLKPPRNDPTNL